MWGIIADYSALYFFIFLLKIVTSLLQWLNFFILQIPYFFEMFEIQTVNFEYMYLNL